MRNFYFLAIVLLFSACGGRKINHNFASSQIATSNPEVLHKSDIDIVSISQTSKSEAVVETKLQTAFRLEKKGSNWVIQEARLGHGQWEKVENLQQVLTRIKTEETQIMLDKIADAILRYKKKNGKAPAFHGYVALSDILSPQYLTPLIRLDAWRRPFEALLVEENSILLRSDGPDGKTGTSDDIIRLIGEPRASH
jgi:hypothetical protein